MVCNCTFPCECFLERSAPVIFFPAISRLVPILLSHNFLRLRGEGGGGDNGEKWLIFSFPRISFSFPRFSSQVGGGRKRASKSAHLHVGKEKSCAKKVRTGIRKGAKEKLLIFGTSYHRSRERDDDFLPCSSARREGRPWE